MCDVILPFVKESIRNISLCHVYLKCTFFSNLPIKNMISKHMLCILQMICFV